MNARTDTLRVGDEVSFPDPKGSGRGILTALWRTEHTFYAEITRKEGGTTNRPVAEVSKLLRLSGRKRVIPIGERTRWEIWSADENGKPTVRVRAPQFREPSAEDVTYATGAFGGFRRRMNPDGTDAWDMGSGYHATPADCVAAVKAEALRIVEGDD